MNFTFFEYLEEPPNFWGELLTRHRLNGITHVRSHVLWGAHEQLKGIRDFNKSPRLRLEKFLRTAQEQGLSVELILGFPSSKDSFPAWTFGLDRRGFVPSGIWDGVTEGFALTEVPSLHQRELFEDFAGFVEEVMRLISLYRGGPVSGVRIDFGVYEADLNLVETPEYGEALALRYPSIEAFNFRYQTLYKGLSSAASKQGIRALQDKRAWLAAFDYKWCRGQMLLRLKEELFALPSIAANIDLFKVAEHDYHDDTRATDWAVAVDGILLESSSPTGAVYPFAPGAFIHPQPVKAFRLAEYVFEHADRAGVPVHRFGIGHTNRTFNTRLLVVLAGKYMTSAAASALGDYIAKGGHVLFPLEAPQYDEEMRGYEWGSSRLRVSHKFGDRALTRTPCDAGAVWSPAPSFSEEDGLWNRVTDLSTALLAEMGAAV